LRKVFLIAGILLSTIAVFAQQIGIDNDEGWGRGRIILLGSGLAIILADVLLILFQHELSGLKRHISVFFNRYLNFSYFTQIIIVSFIITITVLVAYTWFTQPNAKDSRNNYNYYSELARGFKLGNLYLAEKPSPALLSLSNPYDYFLRKQHKVEDFPWDVSLYNNKFYTYWGPAPSLILTIFSNNQLSRLGDHYVALAFAYGLFLYATLIVGNFWHKSLQNAPVWLFGISLLTIGFAAPTTTMLRESRIYGVLINQ
jgi:hypothetical protein